MLLATGSPTVSLFSAMLLATGSPTVSLFSAKLLATGSPTVSLFSLRLDVDFVLHVTRPFLRHVTRIVFPVRVHFLLKLDFIYFIFVKVIVHFCYTHQIDV